MKMFNANGRMSVIAKTVFESNMARLRAGENPMEIATTLHEQTKLIEYNGPMLDNGVPTIWYWSSFKKGQNWWSQLKPRPVRITPPANQLELYSYLSAYIPSYSARELVMGTLIP